MTEANHGQKRSSWIEIQEMERSSSQDSINKEYEQTQWKPGWKARFPWLGFGALFSVVIAAGAAIAVLLVSDKRAQSSWPEKVTPNVLLAAINAFANIMLAIGIGQGVAIAWWRKVLRGATVNDLHHSWEFSTSLASMIKGFKYLNFIALAALAAKLAIIDSILLQRATQTYQANDPIRNLVMSVPHMTNFPDTGVVSTAGKTIDTIKNDFQTWVVTRWGGGVNPLPTTAQFVGCNGTCEGTFEGIGFAFNCDQRDNVPFNLSDPIHQNGSSIPVFDVNFEMSWANATKNYTSITFDIYAFFADPILGDCNGQVIQSHCEIRPALLDIDFTITDNSQTSDVYSQPTLGAGKVLNSMPVDGWNDAHDQAAPYKVKKFLPIAEDGSAGQSKLGGVFLALQTYLGASANATYNTATKKWRLDQAGTFALQSQAGFSLGEPEPGSCTFNYMTSNAGPTWTVVQSINALGLQLTSYNYQATSATDGMQQVKIRQQALGIHYKTHKGFMAGAIVSMIVCALLVLPAYWGFWELGRPVSLAPVEIANAFRAPVLENQKASNSVVTDLLKEVGHRKVMFGEMAEGRLAVEEMSKVKRVGTAPV